MFSFLIYSPFNLVPNSISSLSPFYLSPWPPPIAVVSTVWSFWVLSLYSSINLSFWLSLPSLKVVARGYFILTFFYLRHNTPSIHLSSCEFAFVMGLFRLAYNSPSLSSPPMFHSFIITSDSPSLIQPFYHLHHPSLVSGCLCVPHSLPCCLLTVLALFNYFFSFSLQLFTLSYPLLKRKTSHEFLFICHEFRADFLKLVTQ